MNWEISFPVQDRSDLLATELRGVLGRAVEGGQLNENESAIARQVAMRLLDDGGAEMTFGDAQDRLEAMSLPERRTLFDQARVACGMETIAVAEQQRKDAVFDRELERVTPPPPPRWSEWQGCMAKGCRARPVTSTGALRPVSVERWWCEEHKHLAAEGDLEEHEEPYTGQFTLGGRPIPTEKEKARIAAWHEERREKEERLRRGHEEQRRAEGEAIEKAKQDYSDTAEISVMGIRVRPDLRRVQ